jgi:hypothetical protein
VLSGIALILAMVPGGFGALDGLREISRSAGKIPHTLARISAADRSGGIGDSGARLHV